MPKYQTVPIPEDGLSAYDPIGYTPEKSPGATSASSGRTVSRSAWKSPQPSPMPPPCWLLMPLALPMSRLLT